MRLEKLYPAAEDGTAHHPDVEVDVFVVLGEVVLVQEVRRVFCQGSYFSDFRKTSILASEVSAGSGSCFSHSGFRIPVVVVVVF